MQVAYFLVRSYRTGDKIKMKSNWFTPFIQGLQSVVNVSGMVKGVISSSVAEGVESGFYRITPKLVKLCLVFGLLLTGLLMFALGLSNMLESILHFAGLGYLLTGIVFIAVGVFYYLFNR